MAGDRTTGKVTVLLDHITNKVFEHFPPGYDVAGVRLKDPGAIDRLRETELLITCITPVDRPLIEQMPHLRYVHVFGVGVDKLDLPVLWERGILVSNTLGHNAPSVADHALMLTLVLARRFVRPYRDLKDRGEWRGAGDDCWEMGGKTMGVLGFGYIGKACARRAAGFDMRVIGWNRNPDRPRPPEAGVEFFPLDTVLRESDVLMIATPLSQQTRGLIGRDQLARMKPSAVIVNVGRGPIIDEAALAEAVESGRLAGAGLDVTAREPIEPDSPLLKVDNIVITPHYGGGSSDSRARGRIYIYDNVARYFRGETPARLVTEDSL